ncbi:ArsA family ATPase [Romeria aff. gracilis LEGE 07310]|uniref:ArsA family ATPase n=1 Tax=Vasconcelosia minhoensis LEGE 07310 TaxID=915328 RepID=A0A8J7DN48_9CYAN|nr:ArsA family ATPase [Romeria gracilis]MBE9079761.1 ArsA family ATPase [Romeria aff. gracilis LEGE 07310]
MTLILTFLGKGGTGRTTVAIAAAKQLAEQGQRVLLLTQDAGPAFGLLLGAEVGSAPQPVSENLQAVQLHSTTLLEQNWERLKQFEAKYLRDPFFKAVYGQELSLLPGLDDALALNAIREFDGSGEYDVIVHDGSGDQATLRLWGTPEGIDWYFRRFKAVLQSSQFYRSISPFIQPVTGAILSSGNATDLWDQPATQEVNTLVNRGKALVTDPMRLRAYVVTTADESAIATGRYLWSAAQQIGLTVAGALLNQADSAGAAESAFSPLPVNALPTKSDRWQPLMAALPPLTAPVDVPAPMTVDVAAQTVKLFFPAFDKKQVKLTQYGPEVTVEAGDQRRNLTLPPELKGRSVTGAKFQLGYLIITFG